MAAPYNVFVGQTDDDSNFADVTLVSDDVEIKNLTTLVKSLKVSSLEERKCPQSCNPSRIVELLKYLATITTFVNISSPRRLDERNLSLI